jgi:hypothetical protein
MAIHASFNPDTGVRAETGDYLGNTITISSNVDLPRGSSGETR